MATILAFPRPQPAEPRRPCPMLEAACNAAEATRALCETKNRMRNGLEMHAAASALDEAFTLESLLIAAANTISLTGARPHDRQVAEAINRWFATNGRHVE